MTSLYWAAFTFGRFISAPISSKVKPHIVLFCANIGSTLAILILAIFQNSKNVGLLWAISVFYGCFLSPVFPGTFAFPPNLGMPVDNLATSFFVVGGAIGDMIVPAVVGVIMASIAPSVLIYTILILEFVVLALFSILVYGIPLWCSLEANDSTLLK